MTREDIAKMKHAYETMVSAGETFRKAGLGVERLCDLLQTTIAASEASLKPPDPWEVARALVNDILDAGVPSRTSAIALAEEAKKMLEVLDKKEACQ